MYISSKFKRQLSFNWHLKLSKVCATQSRRFYKTHLIQLSTLSYLVVGVRVIVFNATFNNISVISWRSVLLVEETAVPTSSHNVVSSTPRLNRGFELTTPVMIGTDCMGS
jgi:hypothetical protein